MNTQRFPVIWLTGNSGAGKTTLAQGIQQRLNNGVVDLPCARRVVILDGDAMRATISTEEGFSPEDRRRHNLRVARLARLLSEQSFLVVVAVIAPFERVRAEMQSICDPLWIYVQRSNLDAADRPYEPPMSPHLIINNDVLDPEQGRDLLQQFIVERTMPMAVAA